MLMKYQIHQAKINRRNKSQEIEIQLKETKLAIGTLERIENKRELSRFELERAGVGENAHL